MSMTLILLRHGESEWNAKNLFTGWVDVDLNAKGEAEAKRGGELLVENDLLPDVLHTSLLKRAIRTSQIALQVADRHWIETKRHWRLNERHYAALPPELRPQTECLKDVLERALPYWYDEIVPDLGAGKKVLVAAHGNSLRAIVKHLDQMGDAEVVGLNIPT